MIIVKIMLHWSKSITSINCEKICEFYCVCNIFYPNNQNNNNKKNIKGGGGVIRKEFKWLWSGILQWLMIICTYNWFSYILNAY